MIRFLSDWQLYPDAIVDYNTPNESFLRIVSLYKEMGIKNYHWPLALLQKDLQGVDPHADDLTDDQKIMIGLECRYNPWYILREVIRVPTSGADPVPLRANRGNMALFWCFFCHIDIALIQPRQTGKSLSADTLMVILMYVILVNTKIALITKDDGLRRSNIERLKGLRDTLPGYIINKANKDSDNQTTLTYKALGNSYETGVSQSNERSANNMGRGLTVPIIQLDEGPFVKHIETTLPAALAATTAARDAAKINGTPYGNIYTTTAGKKDDRDGKFMYDLIHEGAVWNEAFFDAPNEDVLLKLVRTNCIGHKALVNATLSHRQLGYTDEWLFEKITEAKAVGEVADRDFMNRWTSGTQSSPLTPKLNEIIRESECDPEHNEISKDSYIFRWYVPEEEIAELMASGKFILSMDSSEALGRDSIALVMISVADFAVVGGATINETNLIRFANFLAGIMVKYENTILVPERKSTGLMIVDAIILHLLRNGQDPYKRIYNLIVDESSGDRSSEYKEINVPLNRRPEWTYERYKKYFGFNTNKASRELLYSSVLQNAAKTAGHVVHDKTLSTEIRGLVVKNGRIDHNASGHDDMVIAWLLGIWFLTHSKNLGYYGIDTEKLYSVDKTSNDGVKLSEDELLERERQRILKAEFDEVCKSLSEAENDLMVLKLEHKLRSIDSRMRDMDTDDISVDAMIKKMSEKRSSSRQLNRNRSKLDSKRIWGR